MAGLHMHVHTRAYTHMNVYTHNPGALTSFTILYLHRADILQSEALALGSENGFNAHVSSRLIYFSGNWS